MPGHAICACCGHGDTDAGTFNLNNLFDRWNFAGALEALQEGVRTVDATFVFDDPERT
jgi:hypothetical protein